MGSLRRTSQGLNGYLDEHATVAKAAPEDNPKSMVAMAMATSKCLEAPTMAARVACSHGLYRLLKQDSLLCRSTI